MDIAGAKALKERLGSKAGVEARAAPTDADPREDAPPVYRWTGVIQPAPVAQPDAGGDEDARARGTSFFRRLGLSFR